MTAAIIVSISWRLKKSLVESILLLFLFKVMDCNTDT